MIYPKDIKAKQFSKGFSGYKMEEVDVFLDEVASDYEKMLTDNAELIKKIEVVVAKLEEYRSNEESISNALLNAQKINEQVIREGKNKADLIIREATFKAERLVKNAQKDVEQEQETLNVLRKEVSDFRARLFAIYRSHLDMIDSLPYVEEEKPEEPAPEQPAEQPAAEAPAPEATEAPAPEAAPEKSAEDDVRVFTPEETGEAAPASPEAQPEAPADPALEVSAAEAPEAEDTDDGQLLFGSAAEKFKDIDLKFGSDYDYSKE